MRTILVSLCVVAAVFSTTTARAQHLEPAIPRVSELGSFWPQGHAMGQFDMFTNDAGTLLGFHFNAWGRIVPAFALEGTFGFLHIDPAMGGSESAMTNPRLSAYWVGESPKTLIRVGAGLAPPLMDDEDAGLGLTNWLAGGMQDLWKWAPNHLSLIPTFRIDGKNRDSFAWGADVEMNVLVPTEDGFHTELHVQGGGDFTVLVHPVFHVGARLQMAWFATAEDSDGDRFQLSTVPFMRFLFGAGFVEGRFVINIDEPGGFSFDDGKIWLFQIRGGARF